MIKSSSFLDFLKPPDILNKNNVQQPATPATPPTANTQNSNPITTKPINLPGTAWLKPGIHTSTGTQDNDNNYQGGYTSGTKQGNESTYFEFVGLGNSPIHFDGNSQTFHPALQALFPTDNSEVLQSMFDDLSSLQSRASQISAIMSKGTFKVGDLSDLVTSANKFVSNLDRNDMLGYVENLNTFKEGFKNHPNTQSFTQAMEYTGTVIKNVDNLNTIYNTYSASDSLLAYGESVISGGLTSQVGSVLSTGLETLGFEGGLSAGVEAAAALGLDAVAVGTIAAGGAAVAAVGGILAGGYGIYKLFGGSANLSLDSFKSSIGL